MTREERAAYYRERRVIRALGEAGKRLPELVQLDDVKRKSIQRKYQNKVARIARPRWVRRAEYRNKLIPVDKICMHCGKKKEKNNQWVIKKLKKVIIWVGCLSCWMKNKNA